MDAKKILYLARAIDLSNQLPLHVAKIGVAAERADHRIKELNSTKMPIKVELEAVWSFQDSVLGDAYKAEQAAHSLLAPTRVNGEWFEDADDELADNIDRFVHYLGGKPLSVVDTEDEQKDLKSVATKQESARKHMESAFEPMVTTLDELEIEWDYMTWKVGMTSPFGRLNISVRQSGDLYIVLKNRNTNLSELFEHTEKFLDWKEGEVNGYFLASTTPADFIQALRYATTFSHTEH